MKSSMISVRKESVLEKRNSILNKVYSSNISSKPYSSKVKRAAGGWSSVLKRG